MTMESTAPGPTMSQRADALEEEMIHDLDINAARSVLFTSGELDPTKPQGGAGPQQGRNVLMGDDPRLQKMPKQPTLLDFYKYRFGPASHLLQSATHALKAGCDEKIVLACLLHDIGVIGFIRSDHGYWGAQTHRALRR